MLHRRFCSLMEGKDDPVNQLTVINQQTVINQHNPQPSPLPAADLSNAAFSCHIQKHRERGEKIETPSLQNQKENL